MLALAYRCQEAGGSATCTLNAADEIAVEAFLEGRITFPGIYTIVSETLERMPLMQPGSVDDILEVDRQSRAVAGELVRMRSGLRAVTA